MDRRSRPVPSLDEALAPLLATATRVAAYLPFGTEPRITVRQGWLLPVVTPDFDLDWGVAGGPLVTRGRLTEPDGALLGPEAIASCDVVLVPALLVARDGTRLGKGKGCYDRALARATGLTVAVLGDGELVDALPREPHDVPVAAAATPSLGVIRLPTKM
ncbi:MAG: 5-formyltetrahydrofolate cyclo-ligase [Frankiales bacterium]|nr:5-formyltetrahydrofolate cyclo-ligase [Frankiales bacterium]